jgi:hypothetical protein
VRHHLGSRNIPREAFTWTKQMNTLRVTTTPNSAVRREPLYCAPDGLPVNGKQVLPSPVDGHGECRRATVSQPALGRNEPCCSVRPLGGLFLQDDAGTTVSAEIWKDCPGWATARVEIHSGETPMTVYFFRLRVGDRVESSNLLTELARRVATLLACGRLGIVTSVQTVESSARHSFEQSLGLNVQSGRQGADVVSEGAR